MLEVPEGLSASEVGKELGEHAERHHDHLHRHDKMISIAEAVLLSIVTLTAAWSGYSAAKWNTESSLKLAKASATRTKALGGFQESQTVRVGDALTFNAWFGAYMTGDREDQRVAARRFRPDFAAAFRAWLATKPFQNPDAPKGPQAMPQYHPVGEQLAKRLHAEADAYYAAGQHAGETSDKFIRVTVILASVLFLVGLSSHFPFRSVRIGLVLVGAGLVIFAGVQLLQLPGLPD
jgi:hypothetical protein